MDRSVRDIYVMILKHGFKVVECKTLSNGCVSIALQDPKTANHYAGYQVDLRIGGDSAKYLRPPPRDQILSYLLVPKSMMRRD